MDLSDLPIRINGSTTKVDASWWNDIRTILLGLFGTGVTATVQQTITDNTTAVVTDLIFASASFKDFEVIYTSVRGTARQSGKLRGFYDTQWNLMHESSNDDCGLTFSINTTTGQVSYILTSTGTSGKLQWKVISTFAAET